MMKGLLLGLILISVPLFAGTTYYISATGSDAANGTSILTPWQTPGKIYARSQTLAFSAGDSILFKRGETFTGQVRLNDSGSVASPIVIGAYGTGARPIIYGDGRGLSWTQIPGRTGYYQAYCGAGIWLSTGYQWYSSTLQSFGNPLLRDANPTNWPSFYTNNLTAGTYAISAARDTILLHTFGSVSMPSSRDSLRVLINCVILGYDPATTAPISNVIVRDLDLRSCEDAVWISDGTNIKIRSVSGKNNMGQAVYTLSCVNSLCDSCSFDSVGNTALYMTVDKNCTFRADTVSNVVSTLDGLTIPVGDMAGIGVQGSLTNSADLTVGWNVVEYCKITNVHGFIDFYWNYRDTIRNNVGTAGVAGMAAHGTDLYIANNDLTGVPGNFDGGNVVNTGTGTVTYTGNNFHGVSGYGIWLSTNGGSFVFTNNSIATTGAGSTFLWYKVSGVTSTGNSFCGPGIWKNGAGGTAYSTLALYQSGTGYESGSSYSVSCVSPVLPWRKP
jgi:hypothetical protein